MTEELESYNDLFEFIEENRPGWQWAVDGGKVWIRTNGTMVDYEFVEQMMKTYKVRISSVGYFDMFGIAFSITKERLT